MLFSVSLARFDPNLAICFILVLSIPLFLSIVQHKGLYEKRAEKIGLKYVTDIPLPGGTSRFDYQTIDEVH